MQFDIMISSRFQNAKSEKFMEILNEEIGRNHEFGWSMNVTTIMDSWTSKILHPIVRCTRAGKGRIRLTQMPYPRQLTANENATKLWWIPLAITDARRPDFSPEGRTPRVWLTPEQPTLEIPYFSADEDQSNWILINGEMSSYVRVFYDEHNWRLLARQLLTNHTVIPRLTRVQLLEDAYTMATIEKPDLGIVKKMTEYLNIVKDEFVRTTITFDLPITSAGNRNRLIFEPLSMLVFFLAYMWLSLMNC